MLQATHPAPHASAGVVGIRCLNGARKDERWRLPADGVLRLGRTMDQDVVLSEEMASRCHAVIERRHDGLWLEDLSSTNGTYLNGERITRAALKLHDRIMIGAMILEVFQEDVPRPPHVSSGVLAGLLGALSLDGVLQMLGAANKSGCLVVESMLTGRIYLSDGRVRHAAFDESPSLCAQKVFNRMIRWTSGAFVFETRADVHPEATLDANVESMLLDATHALDEWHRLEPSAPDLDAVLSLPFPLGPPLRDLTQTQLDTLQLSIHAGTTRGVLDLSPDTDWETLRDLLELISTGYLSVE